MRIQFILEAPSDEDPTYVCQDNSVFHSVKVSGERDYVLGASWIPAPISPSPVAASRTVTLCPSLPKVYAAARPARPHPTMMTSSFCCALPSWVYITSSTALSFDQVRVLTINPVVFSAHWPFSTASLRARKKKTMCA